MALLVQKFGGTSLGTLACIANVAQKIIASRAQGHEVIVVVSAMSGETDRLIKLARDIHPEPEGREYAVLVSTGEQVAMALLAMELIKRGCAARSFAAHQIKIYTDSAYQKARILEIEYENLRAALSLGIVPIIAGFQGVDNRGDLTTLGRGGSDTTAVAIAAALKVHECQIYTDVEGVYTADPRVVHDARRLDQITFEEMLELASLGAKVLQNRAVEFAGKYRVPLRVLSSFVEGPGTLITFEENPMERALVSGITFNRNAAKITIVGVPDIPGMAHKILSPLSAANIDIDMIIQNGVKDNFADFTLTVSHDDYPLAMKILQREFPEQELIGSTKIGKLSIVGVGMRSHPGVASKMFEVLGKEGINIQFISTSEIKISVVIDEKYLELGARSLHAAFGLEGNIKNQEVT